MQYPRLGAQVTADLATLRWLAWAVAVSFPEFGYEWLLPEFEASIEAELDFGREARNGIAPRTSSPNPNLNPSPSPSPSPKP